METEIKKKPATSGGEREDTNPPSNGSIDVPGDDNRSCGISLPEKRRMEEDGGDKEGKNPSYKEAGALQEQGVDLHSHWKTSLCSFFRRPPGGICRHGDACRYAHGEAELLPRPDKSWDPTSERAKKLLKTNDGDAVSSVIEEDKDAALDLTGLDKCLIGLPMKWASDNLKSFLDGKGISYKTAKKKKGMTVAFVSFADTEQIINAIEVLKVNPLNYKQVKVADAVYRSQKKKQKMEITMCSSSNEDGSLLASVNDVAFGTSNAEGFVAKTKAVCDVVAPLAQMSYKDQLEHKRNSLLQTLKRLTRNARKACPDVVPSPEWVLKSREIGGLPCKFEGIMESPIVDGYRNKCEFSVGCSLEGKVTVGFMLGNFREGVTAVEEPVSCPNVSRISCKYALLFQDFLQSSELPVWNRIDNIGFWRQFTVREGRCPSQVDLSESIGIEIAEVMLIVQVCSLGHEEEQIRSEFNRMTLAFVHGAAACSPPLPLTAIVVQDHKGISNAASADCPLLTLQLPNLDSVCGSGATATTEARIHDYIGNLRFSISPTAFFQVRIVNTLGAERLYSLAGDWAELSQDTILFDICCGTGTIGLTLAHRVGMVVGIEMNEAAVSDANRNAEINGIKNCRFICGKAEDVMGSVLKEYLDAPQHHDVVSRDSDGSGAISVENETNEIICEEDHQNDTVAAANVSAANLRTEVIDDVSAENLRTDVMFACCGDSSIDKLAVSTKHGSLEQPLTDTDDSAGFMGNCTTDVCTTQQNEGSRDTPHVGRCSSNAGKDNAKFTQNLENLLPEDSTVTDADVHQSKRVVAMVDPPRVGLDPTEENVMRSVLKEYFDAPQHHGVVSHDAGCNGAPIFVNETNEIICEEDHQHDTVASANVSAANLRTQVMDDVSAANLRTGVMLPCFGDSSIDKLAESTKDGSSEQPLDTDDSAGFMGNCTAEVSTTRQNEGSRDTPHVGRCSSNASKDNVKFTQNLENLLPGESAITDAAVHQFKRVVAIVDPPRVGLHPTVIKALRTHPRIRQLVYISCNPETLVANAIELCTPTSGKQEKEKRNRGWWKTSNAGLARHRVKYMPSSEAFRPVRAMGVDLFPHTSHCEVVMLLER